MVIGVNLPRYIQDISAQCGEAMSGESKAYVLAFDAMISIGRNKEINDEYLKEEFEKLEPSFGVVKKIKLDKTKRTDFPKWNEKLENAFEKYMQQDAYLNIKRVIEESMEKNKHNIMFHETNACPEFWEQTRLAAGINLAEALLKGAQSLVDSE
jgi:hypothetical protein